MPHEEGQEGGVFLDSIKFDCCDGVINAKGEVATKFIHLIQPIEDEDGEHNIDVAAKHAENPPENPTHPSCPEVVVTGLRKQGIIKRCGYLSHQASDDLDGDNRLKIYKKETTYSGTGTEDSGQYLDGPAILVRNASFQDNTNEQCIQNCTQSPHDDGSCSLPSVNCEGFYNSNDGKYYTTRVETSTSASTNDFNFTVTQKTPLIIKNIKSFDSNGCQTSTVYQDTGSFDWQYDLQNTSCTSFGTNPDGSNIGSFQNVAQGDLSGTENGPSESTAFLGGTSVSYENIVTYQVNEFFPTSPTNPTGTCIPGTGQSYTVDVDLTATFQFDGPYTYEGPLEVVTGPAVPGTDEGDPRVVIPPDGEEYVSEGYVPDGTRFYENGVTIEQALEELKETADWTNSKSDINGNVQVAYNLNNLEAGFIDNRGDYERTYKESRYAILIKNLVEDFQYKVFVPAYKETRLFRETETTYQILNGVTETFTANKLFHIVGGSLNSGITDEEFIDREYSLDPDDYPNIVKIHEDNDNSEQVIVPAPTSIVGPADGEFTAGTIYHIGTNIRVSDTEGSFKYITREPNYTSNYYEMPS